MECGIIEAMCQKLVADGMYFVGIDVIGDKVVEINAESPGDAKRRKALRDRRLPNRHRSPGAPHRLEVLNHWANRELLHADTDRLKIIEILRI